jgi:hypothetical protein
MSDVNPFAAAILPSAQSQRQESSERVGQVRRKQELKKASLQGNDTFEHQVESADALQPVHDEDARHDQSRKRGGKQHPQDGSQQSTQKPDDEEPKLDLKA